MTSKRTSIKCGVAMDMIHSEEELRHALKHLLRRDDCLEGHECLTLYRCVRKKYVDDYPAKNGPKQICSFRSIDEGVLAAYSAGISFEEERPASALYVNINPRHVPDALKATHARYFQWLEKNSGTRKEEVRGGSRADFAGTLYRIFETQILHCKSRGRLSMIDVDDNDPLSWLAQIQSAIGEDAIEMIIETKNGFHVIYHRNRMSPEGNKALSDVLASDGGKGKYSNVSKMNGQAISCALPGTYQADHKTRIISCSCKLGRMVKDST